MNCKTDRNNERTAIAGLDPLTGEPLPRPIGTCIGTALGGAASGPTVGPLSGHIATIAGAAGGAIERGSAKANLEDVDPMLEEAYWRETYMSRDYVKGRSFVYYGPAYRYGVSAYQKFPGRTFSEIEHKLGRDWKTDSGESDLDWARARFAARDAFQRVSASRGRCHPERRQGHGAGKASNALAESSQIGRPPEDLRHERRRTYETVPYRHQS